MKQTDKEWIDGFFQGFSSSRKRTLLVLFVIRRILNQYIKELRQSP